LIQYNYSEQQVENPDAVVGSLLEACNWILSNPKSASNQEVVMPSVRELKIKLFADGADLGVIAQMAKNPSIKGFTTNPTLMRKANVPDYRTFAREVLKIVSDRHVSFEVFSDDFSEMEGQAMEISSWGKNVYVKIPVTNTRGEFSGPLITRLACAGVQLNVTAMMTLQQVEKVLECLSDRTRSVVSLFAGRIADTGRDPVPLMAQAVRMLRPHPNVELIWASPRELLNVFQADSIGCHIITATHDVLNKLALVGKDLDDYSLDTVKMFREDAVKAGYQIAVGQPK
jgi:transaldolase